MEETLSQSIDALVVENNPVADYLARRVAWRAYRTGAVFLFYLFVIAPFIIFWKPWRLRQRYFAWRLKIHDAWGTYFQPKETTQTLAARQGDCNRCGACCRILYRCPYLKDTEDGNTTCSIYKGRPDQCATFPHDIRSIEILTEMGISCSYTFQAVPRIADLLKRSS
jgi:hypothetical protein